MGLLTEFRQSFVQSYYSYVVHCTSERFNQTLVTTLSKVINDQGNDWDVHLDSVAFAYRTKQQSSTKKSPFELLYGVGPRLPPDLQNAEDGKAEVEDEDEDEEAFVNAVVARAEAVTKFIPAVRSEALENIEKAQGKQKRQYDLKRRPPCFDVGDRVYRYNRRRDTRKGGKLNNRYTGPFVIAEVLGKGVFRLETTSGSPVKTTANSRDLKLVPSDGYASPTKSPPTSPTKSPTKSPERIDLTVSPKRKRCRRRLVSDSNVMWVADFNLTREDREVVRRGQLNDKIIDAVNKILSAKIATEPQTTLLSQSASGFAPCSDETVQILHGNSHWITVAGTRDTVLYVDSLRPHQPITRYVARQIRQLFPQHIDENGKLIVSIIPSTPQTNAVDCGVFAAAYATELVAGNVEDVQAPFDISAMRGHLEHCLDAGELTSFPRDERRRHGRRRKVITVAVDEDGVEVL